MLCHTKRRRLILVLAFLFSIFQFYVLVRVQTSQQQANQLSLADNLFRYSKTPNVSLFCTRLLLLIFSAPHEFERRTLIRSTWGRDDRLEFAGVARVFVIASGQLNSEFLRDEHNKFGDILSDAKLTDTYNNLTRKVVSALYWAGAQPWKKLRFVVKVDSDNFVNADVLRRVADMIWRTNGRVWMTGYEIYGKKPYRIKDHKWYISRAEYPQEYYPSYINGPHYMMTLEAARKVTNNETLFDIANGRALRMEDVYVTGIVRHRLRIPIVKGKAAFFIPNFETSVSTLLKKDKVVFAAIHGLNKNTQFTDFQNTLDDPEIHLAYYNFLRREKLL